jgi:flagellar hook-associated protein 1 FlgK
MLGLFGTLSLGSRSLQAQRAGVEVAGQNLANVNNPAYARQRVVIQTSNAVASSVGPQGTGAEAVRIQQIRNTLLDAQFGTERGVTGYLEAQRDALQNAQAGLGEVLDSTGSAKSGLAAKLNDLFAAFQSASGAPASPASRQLLLGEARELAAQFNQTAARLTDLSASIDKALDADATEANKLMGEIAALNDRISSAEGPGGGAANDLRDLRAAKLEELSKLVPVDSAEDAGGSLNLSIGGVALVTGRTVLDTIETYDAGGGRMMVRTATTQTALAPGGGHMQGLIDVRDGALATLSGRLDALAGNLISEVNAAHAGGFGLGGTTGAAFFTGSDAKSIAVNGALLGDPALVQLGGAAGNAGDNTVALALAQLAEKKMPALGGASLGDHYAGTVAELGRSLSATNDRLADQDVVEGLLQQQRDSVSGVSIDEEMADLMKYQKAYEASAKLISTVDEMLDTLLSMKR